MRRVGVGLPLLVVLSACAEESDRAADELWFFEPGHVDQLDPEAVEIAEDIFGLELVEQPTPWGSVTIFPFDRDAFEGGAEPEYDIGGQGAAGRCSPWLWYVTDVPEVLAHELGHAYGLEHVDTPCNIMAPTLSCDTSELFITPAQLRTVREQSWYDQHVCTSLSPSP